MQRISSSLPGTILSTSSVVCSFGIGQGRFSMLRTRQPCSNLPSTHSKVIVSGHHSVCRSGSETSRQTTSSGASMKACCRHSVDIARMVRPRSASGSSGLWRAFGRSYNPCGRRGDPVQRMTIYGVSFDMVGKQPIVLLKTVDGNKFLPIWIGHPEAAAILMKLQVASTPRPMTHDLLSDVLEQLDAKCERVSVTELRDNTFYAQITISVNGSEVEIDSRPSDAIALAVRTQAPIFAADDVIEESSIEFEHEVEDTEEVVEKFKDFLDQVTPEDFAKGEE